MMTAVMIVFFCIYTPAAQRTEQSNRMMSIAITIAFDKKVSLKKRFILLSIDAIQT